MDNHNNLSEVLDLVNNFMKQVDGITCHPKSKLLLYHRVVLPKISWHFTTANFGKTWVIKSIDNLVASYVRQWLQPPISATFSTLI